MVYYKNDKYELRLGKMQEELKDYPDNYFDSIITDPPYEIGFMGKDWDNSGVAFQKETWEKCFRVLKPGGYLLSFGGDRTHHRIACAIEDAGFEIRTTIMWVFGSGFPKSMNIGLAVDKKMGIESPVVGQNEQIVKKQAKDLREGKRTVVESFNCGAPERSNGFKTVSADIRQAQNKWSGWGTCLKPAYEPVIVARKPFKGSLVDNVLEYGVGGINIDGCRIPFESTPNPATNPLYRLENGYKTTANSSDGDSVVNFGTSHNETNKLGRFPANLILTYDESDYDEVCGGFPVGGKNGSIAKPYKMNNTVYGEYGYCNTCEAYDDSGSASRYFYCAKASKQDRDEGCDTIPIHPSGMSNQAKAEVKRGNEDFSGDEQLATNALNRVYHNHNNHPTVKPVSLMKYLIRLVTPKGGKILDPFMGSGSTGKAAMIESRENDSDYTFVGIEMTEEYLPICKARIDFGMGCELEEPAPEVKEETPSKEPKETFERFSFL